MKVIRWILLYPAAVIASMIASLLAGIIHYLVLSTWIGIDDSGFLGLLVAYNRNFVVGGIGGFVHVFTAAWVAPNYSVYVAKVTVVVTTILMICAMFLIQNLTTTLVGNISFFGGLCAAAYMIDKGGYALNDNL